MALTFLYNHVSYLSIPIKKNGQSPTANLLMVADPTVHMVANMTDFMRISEQLLGIKTENHYMVNDVSKRLDRYFTSEWKCKAPFDWKDTIHPFSQMAVLDLAVIEMNLEWCWSSEVFEKVKKKGCKQSLDSLYQTWYRLLTIERMIDKMSASDGYDVGLIATQLKIVVSLYRMAYFMSFHTLLPIDESIKRRNNLHVSYKSRLIDSFVNGESDDVLWSYGSEFHHEPCSLGERLRPLRVFRFAIESASSTLKDTFTERLIYRSALATVEVLAKEKMQTTNEFRELLELVAELEDKIWLERIVSIFREYDIDPDFVIIGASKGNNVARKCIEALSEFVIKAQNVAKQISVLSCIQHDLLSIPLYRGEIYVTSGTRKIMHLVAQFIKQPPPIVETKDVYAAQDDLLTVKEISSMLRLSESQTRRILNGKKLISYGQGRAKTYKRSDVVRIMREPRNRFR